MAAIQWRDGRVVPCRVVERWDVGRLDLDEDEDEEDGNGQDEQEESRRSVVFMGILYLESGDPGDSYQQWEWQSRR